MLFQKWSGFFFFLMYVFFLAKSNLVMFAPNYKISFLVAKEVTFCCWRVLLECNLPDEQSNQNTI